MHFYVLGVAVVTLETRYNALQYNANSVIMWLQSWLPIFKDVII